MTPKQRRFNEYLEAIEKLDNEGHCLARWGEGTAEYARRKGIDTQCLLDTYGLRYLATHFPEYNMYPKIYTPFLNSAEEIECRSMLTL